MVRKNIHVGMCAMQSLEGNVMLSLQANLQWHSFIAFVDVIFVSLFSRIS